MFPATLALIINIFTDVREKALAVAAWTAMAGFAIAIGPISGGWLLEHFSWREQLITAMKTAVLQGAHAAPLVATASVVLCAVVVAIFLPWAPARGRSTMLAWRRDQERVDH
ncbi:MFS family permease [Rhodococcus sp. BE178]